ncbi:hemolysin III family protein [Actinotignum urinale]|uniref:PAQR family membrane homeostasis protein TrhA n=1 Tax=Actinotignum urinale TaxID=190146 RepID=UPI002A7EB95B|nr:hemolysin III family protein [Actinotignum urinale]MDY5128650.1 hemolysin III family protein [Actinotignum urinale]
MSATTTLHTIIQRRKNFLASLPKPAARGWQHAVIAPLALANMIVQSIFAPTSGILAGVIIFGICSVVLFGNSAVYHLNSWRPRVERILRKFDHSNIYLLIAGTYTPISIALMPRSTCILVLSIIWIGATGGILLANIWPDAPRWLSTPIYIALGWVVAWFVPVIWANGGPAVVWLIFAGGLCYTLGALSYGFRWPNPWPRVWGFHEFFHTGTLGGFICHAIAVWLAMFAV